MPIIDTLRNNYYHKFNDNLMFNCDMLLAAAYTKQNIRFFPISWREEDQILEILPNCLYDWDGNEIGMVEGLDCFAISWDMIEEPDGLVMYGSEPSLNEPNTVIWKTDGGNKLLWQAELPYVWNEADILGFEFFTGTGDGGYLGILTEGRQGKDEQENEYRTVLAKLEFYFGKCFAYCSTNGCEVNAHFSPPIINLWVLLC